MHFDYLGLHITRGKPARSLGLKEPKRANKKYVQFSPLYCLWQKNVNLNLYPIKSIFGTKNI